MPIALCGSACIFKNTYVKSVGDWQHVGKNELWLAVTGWSATVREKKRESEIIGCR